MHSCIFSKSIRKQWEQHTWNLIRWQIQVLNIWILSTEKRPLKYNGILGCEQKISMFG